MVKDAAVKSDDSKERVVEKKQRRLSDVVS